MNTATVVDVLPCAAIRFVKELYPRLKPIDDVIERYRDALPNLPPIVVARDGVLVDGYHRWQAHVRENAETIRVETLGDITDVESLRESYRRNARHGEQMSKREKIAAAEHLYLNLAGTESERYDDIATLLSIAPTVASKYCAAAKQTEKKRLRALAWDLWLDCVSQVEIAERIGVTQQAVSTWIQKLEHSSEICSPPDSRQHFDVWTFATTDRDGGGQQSYFGALPPQVIENLLWLFTDPGATIVDLFAGSGTTVDVAKGMGRRVWASDIRGNHYSPHLPIHRHDATCGWPTDAPSKADFVLLDPPYWQQASGRYSSEPNELAEMSAPDFMAAWIKVVAMLTKRASRVAYIISPTQLENGDVVDHATLMLIPFITEGWRVDRRIIVPYSTQQATGQQVTWARENRRLLKLYRDLVVLTR